MSLLRYFKKLELLDFLIHKKATGNQKEFARKAGMSKSMLNEYLKEMKEMGFPIDYDRERNSYFYEKEGSLVKSLFNEQLDEAEMKKYSGGCDYLQLHQTARQLLMFQT